MLQVSTGCPLLESSLTASGTLPLPAVSLPRLCHSFLSLLPSLLPLSASFSPSLSSPPSLHSCDSEALSLLSLHLQRVNEELQVSNLHRLVSRSAEETPSQVLIVISGVSGTKVRSKQHTTSETLVRCDFLFSFEESILFHRFNS